MKRRNRPTIVLSGFFGRGNCGDEAILQAQYEALSPEFDIVISVDERGAYDGFWNWYPYDRCRIVHQANLSVLADPAIVGIHVGGGGLPHGFNAAQVVYARSLDKLACLSGVDAAPARSPAAAQAIASYVRLFSKVILRSEASWNTMARLAQNSQRGADWAVGFPTDGAEEGIEQSGDVVVTIREFPDEFISSRYLSDVAELFRILAGGHRRVVLLPFCPEDERFLDRLPPAARLHREIHWWNPRRVQRCIATASRVVSLGRLHPLIFAANVGTPAAFAEPLAGESRWASCAKARDLCVEHGWAYHASLSELIARLRDHHDLWPRSSFLEGTHGRWQVMASEIMTMFQVHGRDQRDMAA